MFISYRTVFIVEYIADIQSIEINKTTGKNNRKFYHMRINTYHSKAQVVNFNKRVVEKHLKKLVDTLRFDYGIPARLTFYIDEGERQNKMEDLKDRVIEALENVIDPELGIDIMNLGLVYDVKMSDDNKHAVVDMTLTSMGCPLAPVIIEQVETAMLGVDEIEKVDVNIVWEPAWTKDKMSRYAKIALGVIDYE